MTALAERSSPKGAIAQLVERVLCKHEVVGSIPSGSTTSTLEALQAIESDRILVGIPMDGARD
jgi:hypothetical protein